VFIPANTWVSVKNAGTEAVSVLFVFSAPGFENYMRCDSVLANEKVIPLSLGEQKGCARRACRLQRPRREPQEVKIKS
jgi:hypothetical protein